MAPLDLAIEATSNLASGLATTPLNTPKEPAMNDFPLFAAITASLRRIACRLRDAARRRADLEQIGRLDARTLQDIGISHAAVVAASAERRACCA
jgi:uncharacterized protein YjiS (DUF1127 family)